MFRIGDLVHFTHLSGKDPGEVEIYKDSSLGGSDMCFVRWPDHSGSWHSADQLRHAFAAYDPNQADADTPPRRKPSYTLLPWDVLEEVSQVFAVGAEKYAPNDWAKADNGGGDHLEAALRHIVAHMKGDVFDDPALGGSGLRHLSHAAARVLMCIGKEIRND